jgi:hypothetical protein
MTEPLHQRLTDAADLIYLGRSIYSDQVHALLQEAADALRPAPLEPDLAEPITAEWLKEIGFRWHQLDRQPDKQWLLWIGEAVDQGKNVACFEDLGLELSPPATATPTGFAGCAPTMPAATAAFCTSDTFAPGPTCSSFLRVSPASASRRSTASMASG